MTSTVKDPVEATGLSKAAPVSASPVAPGDPSGRTNPVCLEVPVVIRSLAPDGSSASPATAPFRKECHTVIVFDNGCVLRMMNPPSQGQKLILTNPRGHDVVCRVSASRNLPSVKGYIEVEFVEPISNFWHLQEMETAPGASRPAGPSAAVPEPAPPQVPAGASATVPDKAPAQPAPSGGAPTFDDISGLMPFSPERSRRTAFATSSKPAVLPGVPKSKGEGNPPRVESAKPAPAAPAARPTWESLPEKPSTPPVKQFAVAEQAAGEMPHEYSLRNVARSNSILSSSLDPGSEPEEKSGRSPMIFAAAAIVLAAAGAGYYFLFMRNGNVPGPERSVAAVAQQSAAPANNAVPASAAAPAPSRGESVSAEPAQNTAVAPANAATTPLAESQTARSRPNVLTQRQANPASSRAPALTQLKLNLPKSHGSAAMDASSTAPPALDSVAAAGSAAMPNGTFAVRSESQPAPPIAPPAPAAIAAPPASTTVLSPAQLVSSVRPVYPPSAKTSNVQGDVDVNITVSEQGTVTAAKAVSGPIMLRQAAVDAVLKWKYSPALKDGKPTASQSKITVKFRLQ